MRHLILTPFNITFSSIACTHHENHSYFADYSSVKKKLVSHRLSTMEMISDNHIHIDYSSPNGGGSVIWFEMKVYKSFWASGSHKATCKDFVKDVKIEGKNIYKSKYDLFTIPDKNKWILITNKLWEIRLTDIYNTENDMLRFKVKPKLNQTLEESLAYESLEMGKNNWQVKQSGDKLNVSLDF